MNDVYAQLRAATKDFDGREMDGDLRLDVSVRTVRMSADCIETLRMANHEMCNDLQACIERRNNLAEEKARAVELLYALLAWVDRGQDGPPVDIRVRAFLAEQETSE